MMIVRRPGSALYKSSFWDYDFGWAALSPGFFYVLTKINCDDTPSRTSGHSCERYYSR